MKYLFYLSGNCPWLGSPEECHLHFATEHQDCLLDNNIFELNLLCTNRVNYLLSQKDSLFLLHNEFNEEEQKFYSCLYQIVSDKRIFNFSLEFKTTDAEKKFILAKKKVLFYKECIKTDGFLIDVSSVKEELNHPSMITCTVTVTEVTTGTPQDIAIILDDDEEKEEEEKSVIIKKDNKMLVDLECPVCQEYMVPPIFQCQIGHSVCGVCKPKLRDCPSCRGKIGEIRNFTLEKLTEHIMYPCRNRYEGCDYHGNTVEIKQHEQECKYAPIKCPFSDICECEWKGAYKTIVAHVKVNHNDREYIIKEPLFLSTKFSTVSGGTQCITELFNEIFRLRLVYNNEKRKVYASVQMIGPKEDAKKFMYEVIITDLNKNGLILLSKKYCGCINEKRNDISHCSIWPLEIVVPFISETNNEIHAKFRIMKV